MTHACQQPRHRRHYGVAPADVAADLLARMRKYRCRWAVFRYVDGELQICPATGRRYKERLAVYGRCLVGVYGRGTRPEDIVADIVAAGG